MYRNRALRHVAAFVGSVAVLAILAIPEPARAEMSCNRNLTAKVVAFDMPLMWNRLGAQNINGMMFALKRDVINMSSGLPLTAGGSATPGDVALRPDKRPRPLVLRMGAGDCLTITLTNLLAPAANPFEAPPGEFRSDIPFTLNINDQVADRRVSLRFQGTQLVGSIADDGSYVGQNASSLVGVGETKSFTIYAEYDGAYIGTSYGATTGGEGLGGNTANGLWAVLNVNPKNSAFYRSQLTREEMDLATTGYTAADHPHPIIDYEAAYPTGEPWESEGKKNLPIINMVHNGEIVHSDINAIVAYGPSLTMQPSPSVFDNGDETNPNVGKLGHFPPSTYPLESKGYRNPTVPNRLEPFREFTIAFHDETTTKQAFPKWFEDPVLSHTLHSVRDDFMINFGSGGIGSEIIGSRLRVGPMHDCINCAYEEFFLTFFTVGEVGQLTDIPANFGLELCDPALNNCAATGPKANFVLFPDDPSNVHHSYTGDATGFRNVHAGPGEQHVFHLHNHQWLFNADDDNSNYIDAQGVGPGSGYSYWINFGGSGNRNKTAGDAIFHCHFYPHFAQGMWEMWRVHDTFEQGTELAASNPVHTSFVMDGLGLGDGTPAAGARALPDGEVVAGAPIPAVVPLPGKPMAPMPVPGVTVMANPNQVCVGAFPNFGLQAKNPDGTCPFGTEPRNTGSLADVPRVGDVEFGLKNPGYPFWIAGMEHSVGQRPTTPPLDMITQAQAQALADDSNPLWDHPGFADAGAVHGWDGGLPRYTLDGFSAGSESIVSLTRLDFSKEITKAKPFFYPEEGTDLEQAAMAYHAKREHATFLPDGTGGVNFILNGAKPVPGAPYQEPCIDDQGTLLSDAETPNTTNNGVFFSGETLTGMSTRGYSPFDADSPRVYKAANVQFDAVFNKLGYHYPQERIITLWQDVVPTIEKRRPPEPFVLRMNTFDCTQYVHSNVVPKTYELDDYQVRTPTDIIGQHIHLPKWDLTTADGAANGWNYEDGTLSPEMVVEIIEAINAFNATAATPVLTNVAGDPVVDSSGHSLSDSGVLEPADHPFFGKTTFAAQWKGARSTMQRWFADPVVNVQGIDRGLGIIFTHDHYGPSTHQQIGLYATVLVEPAGSKWVHNETGTQLYTRTGPDPEDDGGPTSWQVAILTGADGIGGYTQNVGASEVESYREFYFEYSDFQHAYQPGVYVGAGPDGFPLQQHQFAEGPAISPGLHVNTAQLTAGNADSFRDAIQPSFRQQAPLVDDFPMDIWIFPSFCPGDVQAGGTTNVPRPCPEAISADDPGTYVVNYRNESLVARIFDPNRDDCPDDSSSGDGIAEHGGCQAFGKPGDLAFAMVSNVTRVIPELNDALGLAPATFAGDPGGEVFLPPINQLSALAGGDPFTPMMRAFDGDRVHVKVQAGAHEEEHTKMLHGLRWLQAGSGFGEAKNSGWRNAQPGGISEQFSFRTPVFADFNQRGQTADYAYTMNASLDGWVTGTWGILRSYQSGQNDLFALPTNDPNKNISINNQKEFDRVCPKDAPARTYDITAVLAEDVLDVPRDSSGDSLVTIQDLFPGAHVGRAPDPNGGTLVYNSRTDGVGGVDGTDPPQAGKRQGPLHDPTAILYVHTADLDADDPSDPRCWRYERKPKYDPSLPTCPVYLTVPVEPIVIRANAGECVDVTLRNKLLQQAVTKDYGYPVYDGTGKPEFEDLGDKNKGLYADTNGDGVGDTAYAREDIYFDGMPDLATGNAIIAMVRRDRDNPAGMTSFNTNLMLASPHVGLHPALVEYDVTRSDGTNVGQNPTVQTAGPGEQIQYQWYAGVIEQKPADGPGSKRNMQLVATPVEFGGFNLMPADKIKQGQKGLLGAGVVYPAGSYWTVDAGTTTEATVTAPSSTFRDFTTVAQKGTSMFYANSFPVENLEGEGDFGVAEDAQDMGQMAINYGTEPLWFRFGVNPTDGDGLMTIDAGDAYSNNLVGNVDPETAVFNADPGKPFRMHVLMPFGSGRGSTYDLHGHVWQRDPYVCPGSADLGLAGKCDMGNGHAGQAGTGEVGSQNLGDNPIGFGMGGIESWFPGEHYEIVIPSAGGWNEVQGDYLFRDHMGLGNADGLWGIVRVGDGGGNGGGEPPPPEPKPCRGKKCR